MRSPYADRCVLPCEACSDYQRERDTERAINDAERAMDEAPIMEEPHDFTADDMYGTPDDIASDMAEDFRTGAPRSYSDADIDRMHAQAEREEAAERDLHGQVIGSLHASIDMLAFERGYAAAVDDFRHGLWHDEAAPVWKRGYNEAALEVAQSRGTASLDADLAYERTLREHAPQFTPQSILTIEHRLMERNVINGMVS